MALSLQTLDSLVADMTAAVQAKAISVAVNAGVGKVVRAIIEATASAALWLQIVALQLLSATRLTTSSGSDVDTFVGDFGLVRLPAIAATGVVTVSRYAPVSAATVPVGTIFRSGDGTMAFSVAADSTNSLWSATVSNGTTVVGGYVVPAGTASADIPVIASTPGAAGNVAQGVISLTSGTAGINTVTNAASLVDGEDAESDAALKTRFSDYIASLNKATVTAIDEAVESVQQGIAYHVSENEDEVGNFRPGHFVVTASDASGLLSPTLSSSIYAAVDAVRPICSTFSVQPPAITYADIALTITAGAGATKSALIAPIQAAITAYVDGLSVGAPVVATRIAYIAYSTDPGVASVGGVTIGGLPGDLLVGENSVVKARTVIVN